MNNTKPIDFVIPWVDSNDPLWRQEFALHSNDQNILLNPRFRDWDIFHYWFRGVEKYAPWVNKIHFITYGHIPKWLNTKHPKLNIVKHTDYINPEYLPTFSSHVIELNMHRIKDLSDSFVYFNDDMFLINSIDESFYFINDTPRDACIFDIIIGNGDFAHYLLNNIQIINKYFDKKEVITKNFLKIFNLKYRKQVRKNILLSTWLSPSPWRHRFTGFVNYHLPQPFKKDTFDDVWKNEYKLLESISKNKFRTRKDVNQYLFQIWQLLSGKFIPKNITKSGIYITPIPQNFNAIHTLFNEKKIKIICLNDTEEINDFESSKKFVTSLFVEKFPKKSSFEL